MSWTLNIHWREDYWMLWRLFWSYHYQMYTCGFACSIAFSIYGKFYFFIYTFKFKSMTSHRIYLLKHQSITLCTYFPLDFHDLEENCPLLKYVYLHFWTFYTSVQVEYTCWDSSLWWPWILQRLVECKNNWWGEILLSCSITFFFKC